MVSPDLLSGNGTMPSMQAKGWGEEPRNFRLGVYNGIFVNGAEAFFHSSLVLAPFLAGLGAPAVVIGLIPALRIGGWFLPQLFVASRLGHQPFKMPWYRRFSLIRFGALAVLTIAVFVLPDRPGALALVALAMIVINAVAGGVTGVSFADVTAKVVPHYRLGTFWALRNVIGGILALLAGLVLRRVFASEIAFPIDFGWLFLIGTVLMGIAYLTYSLIREPAGAPAMKEPFLKMAGRIPGVLRRDASFRRYLRVRVLALTALLAEPFYAVYALLELNAPASALGTFVIAASFASIVANFAFHGPADRANNVTILQVGIGLLILAPVTALLAPTWEWFLVVLVFSAAGNTAIGIAAWNLLYAVAPAPDRPLYVGTANTLLSAPSLAPVAAGALAGFAGFRPLFALAVLVGASALAFAFRFRDLRDLDRAALEG